MTKVSLTALVRDLLTHLHEREHPGEVTVHVLHGRVRLVAGA
jgi:hypothetical protein